MYTTPPSAARSARCAPAGASLQRPQLPPRRGTLRPPVAIRDNPAAHPGGKTPPSPYNASGCDARPSLLFSPPGHGFSTRDARWNLLI
jgi:hypothetical protein